MQENWFVARIETHEEAADATENAFNILDSLGTEINYLGAARKKNFLVSGFFDEEIDLEKVRSAIIDSFDLYGIPQDRLISISIESLQDQDWLAEWKKHWKPTHTRKFIVAPTWFDLEDSEKNLIRIDPKMAFGTGTHETTKLCLKAIEDHFQSGMSFLDVGTGTGILSIAASFLGACEILALDTDMDSVVIAKENFSLNGVLGVRLEEGSISRNTPSFDFVCANVTIDIIMPMLPLLIEKASKTLVLSGILIEQEQTILDVLQDKSLESVIVERDGEWISVLAKC